MEDQTRRPQGSIWWRDLVSMDYSIVESSRFAWCMRRGLGDGACINFWKDQWLGIEPLFKVFPLLFEGCGHQQIKLADCGSWSGGKWCWRVPWLNFEDSIRAAEADVLQDILLQVAPTRSRDDSWIWPHDHSKQFTVKSYYMQLIHTTSTSSIIPDWQVHYAELWKSIAPSKVAIFGWRLLLDSLPTRAQLLHRKVLHSDEEAWCPLCHQHREESQHLFMSCAFAQLVWERIASWLDSCAKGRNQRRQNIYFG